MKKLYIIDAHSQIYMAFYAIPLMSNSRGVPTNAVYGFTAVLLKIIREKRPDCLMVAFDSPAPTFRHKEFEDYKATRPPMPDDLAPQIPYIKKILKALRIPEFSLEGYEADDIIGTIAKKASKEKVSAVIVTRDKDADQLLDENVSIYDSKKESFRTIETLKKEKGISPRQVIDMMALSGDASDNIPGVPGIGPKTSLELIKKFGSLEGLYENLEKIKGKKRQWLLEHKAEAELSKRLVAIDTSVPVDINFEDLKMENIDRQALQEIFKELGFKKFLLALTDLEGPAETGAKYTLINTDEKYKEFLKELDKQKVFALDLETTSTSPTEAEIVGISFSWNEGEGFYLPVTAPDAEKHLPAQAVLSDLKPLLENPLIAKVGQNIKYDAIVLENAGVKLKGKAFDTMIGSYLLDPGRPRHNLGDLAIEFLSYRMTPIEELIGKGRKQISMADVPLEKICRYSAEDADVTWRLYKIMEPRLKEAGLEELFREVEMPLVDVLVEMELNGVKVDTRVLNAFSEGLGRRLRQLKERIYKEAGAELSIDSPKQLSELFYEKLHLPVLKTTKTGFSTDQGTLEELAKIHTLPAKILEYRRLSKLKSTYADALPKMVSEKSGRIHASFNQTGTATGRLSSSDPNLQNIPVRTELGREIRRAFVTSRKENILLSADYSQIELRILAHYSRDKRLIRAFKEDMDIHSFVASQIFGVSQDDVTPQMRRKAKAVNFGVIYGLSPYGLSRQIDIPQREAEKFINDYFDTYRDVEKFIFEVLERARSDGFVRTILGRRRYINGIKNVKGRNRNLAERTAVNTVIQGSAADMIKVAMVKIHRRIAKESRPSTLLIQIHDELLFELPQASLEAEREMITAEMTGAVPLDVPVKVNCATGKNWMEV